MSRLRILFLWPVLLVELLAQAVRHGWLWFAHAENRIHVINLLVISASTYFLFGTIRMFMPNMPVELRLMITIIIGVLEYMALEHVAQVLRASERSGIFALDLKRFDRRFVAMTLVLAIAATLNIMGSYVDVHYRLAGDAATAAFEDHEAQDVHEAALAAAYPDLRGVSEALAGAERTYRSVESLARRGLQQQEGEHASSFYGVNAGAGPRYEALGRVAGVAAQQAEAMATRRAGLEAQLAQLQAAYAQGTDAVQRDVLRQEAYDRLRRDFDALALPDPDLLAQVQATLLQIHTTAPGRESEIPSLENAATLALTATGLAAGPQIPERDVSRRQAIGNLSGHIRYAWHDLLRGGTEAWIAAGVALVLDGSVLLLSMAWYALLLLPYLLAILLRDVLGISITSVARAAGTVVGRAALLPGEVAVVGASEYRHGWKSAREGWDDPDARPAAPATDVLEDVILGADTGRARRVIRVFAAARFAAEVPDLGGPGFVVEEEQLQALVDEDRLVWSALITELLGQGGDSPLLRLKTGESGLTYLFRPEVISSAKRLLDGLDSLDQPSLGHTMRRTLGKYREELSGADA